MNEKGREAVFFSYTDIQTDKQIQKGERMIDGQIDRYIYFIDTDINR